MPNYDFDHTDYHELPLDYILRLARQSMGLELKVVGDKLTLVNSLGQTLSSVTISYAEKALNDVNGRPIKAYLFSAGTDNDDLALVAGDGTVTTIRIPRATKADKDIEGKDLMSYLYNIQTHNDNLRIARGDGTTYELTVPFATKALNSNSGKHIDTFAASLAVDGDELVLKDALNNELNRITVHFADEAEADADGNVITESYASALQTGLTTVKLVAKDGTQLSEITVPYATAATNDNSGESLRGTYGADLVVDGQRIALEAKDGTQLSSITVPFSTISTDAINAVETVAIVGDQIKFTTYGGTSTSLTIPYALRATADGANNEIVSNYVANVTNDAQTGEITFYAKDGSVIATLIPTVDTAVHDIYGNDIADFVKTIAVDANSDYVTVTHGTGTSDTLVINYANKAWKDTQGNIIKNVYIKNILFEQDQQDQKYYMVAYNGENVEIFRREVIASTADYATEAGFATKDAAGNDITDYLYNGSVSGSELELVDGNGNSKVTYDPIPSGGNNGDVLTKAITGPMWATPVQELPVIQSGDAGKALVVNNSETGTEWATVGGGGGLPANPTDNSFLYYLQNQNYGIGWEQDWRSQPTSKYFRFNTGYVQDPDDDGYWQLMSANTVYDFEAGVRTPFCVVLPCESPGRTASGYFYELPYREAMNNGVFISTISPCIPPSYEIDIPSGITVPTMLTKQQLRTTGIFDALCRKTGINGFKVNLLPQWYTPDINSEDTTKLVESTVFIAAGSSPTNNYYVIAGFLTSDTKINTGVGLIPAGLAYFYDHTYDNAEMLYSH